MWRLAKDITLFLQLFFLQKSESEQLVLLLQQHLHVNKAVGESSRVFASMASESRQEKGSSSGYCYSSDISSSSAHHHQQQQHLVNQMQSFESNPELFNLTTGMEMLTFPSKNRDMDGGGSNNHHNNNNNNNSVMWKGFYQTSDDQNLIESSWQDHTTTTTTNNNNSNRLMVDDSSLRCVFPCEGTERPSQGLSLSLSSNKPSTIGLQSFELRDSNQQDGFFGKSTNFHQHQQLQQQHQMFQSSSSSSSSLLHLKHSKYLPPTQELLDELCNLGTKTLQKQIKPHKINQLDDENGSSGSSRKNPFLYSLDLLELQKRKSKLLSMLEEVDRRYRQYCDQMRGVESTFESVVGMGSASVYSTLASKAMSKHFRCLRDGIVDEIKATKKAMGEKEVPIAPGTTKGETPRLRVLDQTLRQQRAFQQMSMLESHPWRPQRGLPERSVSVLRAWLFEHFLHPYPSDVDKHILARQTGLSRSQVSNWFINARVRLWKPMVEEMYLEETKEQENIAAAASASASSSDWITNLDENTRATPDHHQLYSRLEDHKPTPDQLIHGESDHQSLSSIINIPSTHRIDTENTRNHHHHNQFQLHPETNHHHDHGFGVVNMDFSVGAYNNGAVMNHHLMGNGVSLTLGLQQHGSTGGSGMRSLSFTSPVTVAAASQHQHSLYYHRDDDDHHHQIEDCEQVQYSSILDGEAAAAVHENLPYRNLMGGAHQLLHDLA